MAAVSSRTRNKVKQRRAAALDLYFNVQEDCSVQGVFNKCVVVPFVPKYVHLALRLRLVCKLWRKLFTEGYEMWATVDYINRPGVQISILVYYWRETFPHLRYLDLSHSTGLEAGDLIEIAGIMGEDLHGLSTV